MSLQGQQSPLSVNVSSCLISGVGTYAANTGVFTSTNNNIGFATPLGLPASVTNGSVISNTVLNTLYNAMSLAVALPVSATVLANLNKIGSSTIPALGNSAPSTYPIVGATIAIDSYRYLNGLGFIKYLAGRANASLSGNINPASQLNSYRQFCQDFINCYSYKVQTNQTINTFVNSKTFLKGIFSNMNDLTTADIAGVNQSMLFWGQDLIKSGKVINLNTIDKFGLPSNFLKTLNANNAVTEALTVALVYSGLTTTEITDIIINGSDVTAIQEQKIFGAFSVLVGNDLKDILTILNCQTQNLNSLADLLNPAKIFPTSYTSLVVPEYRTNTTSSKVYYNIYASNGVNSSLNNKGYGSYLTSILSPSLAIACGAFSYAMMQIRNIKNVDIQKFSQVVANLETTTGLDLVNGTNLPTNLTNVDSALTAIANGSGPNGTIVMNDFYPAATLLTAKMDRIEALIKQLQTSTLSTIYSQMVTNLTPPNTGSNMATLINNATTEISSIFNNSANASAVAELNSLWSSIGSSLSKEDTLRTDAGLSSTVTGPTYAQTLTASNLSIFSFVETMNSFALETNQNDTVSVLEAIANELTYGGQSIIALMREIRNANRLSLCGLELDNDISEKNITQDIISQGGTGTVGPQTISTASGVITKVTGGSSDPDYPFPGNLDTPNWIIPPNVDIFNTSTTVVQTPSQALQEVIDCNCDCWDLLE
jgi:hypothetical protein